MMFHNVLMTSLTPLRNFDEINCWENRPFTTIWPEDIQSSTPVYQPKGPEVTKTIKKRSKRNRTAYTTDQLRVLEKTFIRIKYINSEERKQLADTLKISEKSIKVWFQNRRMKEKRESSESSDSSTEVTTSGMSPPRSLSPISPVQDTKVLPNEEANQIHNSQEGDTSHYQLPNFHFCNLPEYQHSTTSVMPPTEPFTEDRSIYPTYYYPTMQDYYFGESYYDNGNVTNHEPQWSATTFDLNYFQ